MEHAIHQDTLKRLRYIEGHLAGIRKMIEEDKYCVDILKQTYAVRKAIEKLEAAILAGHMREHVVPGIKDGHEEQIVKELMDLYNLNQSNSGGAVHDLTNGAQHDHAGR